MSGTNALIPLQFRPTQPAPDVGQAMSLASAGLQLQQQRQQVQSQNALRNILGTPGAVDPATGIPTPDTFSKVMAVDPATGMKLQQNALAMRGQQAQLQEHQVKRYADIQQLVDPVRTSALNAYMAAKKAGVPDDAANMAGQQALSEGLSEIQSGGFLSDEEKKQLQTKFDYPTMSARSLQWQQMQAQQGGQARADAELGIKVRGLEDTEAETKTSEDLGERKLQFEKDKLDRTNPDMGGAATTTGADVHGDDYLKTLPNDQQTMVKALAGGRMSFPSGYALRSPYWQKMVQAVSQYDPSFDAVNYNSRAKTRADFTSGKSAQNITSFNTAIGHLGSLADAADKLGNSWSPTYNTVANWVEGAKGDPRVNNFNISKKAVTDELTRAFRGTGGSQAEVEAWEKTLDAANSPAQIKGAITQAVDLLHSRIDAVGEQYQKGMGTTADPVTLLSPEARKTLKRLEGGASSSPAAASALTQKGGVYQLTNPDTADADYGNLPSGASFVGPDGKTYRKP